MFKKIVTYLKKEQWSPYLAGACIGVLSLFSLVVFSRTIGTSVTFVKMAALLEKFFFNIDLKKNMYYHQYLETKGWIDWQVMLLVGLFIGAFLAKKLSKKKMMIKEFHRSHFHAFKKKNAIFAFLGGAIVMYGARLAGGCTSGHAISGGFQLALSGWLFMMGVFILGIPTAMLLYRRVKQRERQ